MSDLQPIKDGKINIEYIQRDLEDFNACAQTLPTGRVKIRMLTAIGWLDQALRELAEERRKNGSNVGA